MIAKIHKFLTEELVTPVWQEMIWMYIVAAIGYWGGWLIS